MNKNEFIALIREPHKVTSIHKEKLEEVISNFPYCQSAHILIAKIANDVGSMLAKQKLSVAAAYTADRKNLRRIIQELQYRETPVEAIEVTTFNEQEKNLLEVLGEPEPIVKVPEQAKVADLTIDKEKTDIKNFKLDEKDRFLQELHDNLLKLRDLKNHAAHFSEEQKIGANLEINQKDGLALIIEEIKQLARTVDQKNIEIKFDVTDSTIFTSRLEEVLVDRDIEGRKQTGPVNFMIDYLNYLGTKRNNFMRDKNKMGEIIDKFIKDNPAMPSMNSIKPTSAQEDLAAEILKLSKTPVSENFAKILISQGKLQKAKDVYLELILKFPEKKAYFEALIEAIKK